MRNMSRRTAPHVNTDETEIPEEIAFFLSDGAFHAGFLLLAQDVTPVSLTPKQAHLAERILREMATRGRRRVIDATCGRGKR